MRRVAIYFENRLGRNDGNPLYVWAALKRRQARGELEVDHLIPAPGAFGHLAKYGVYDAHLWVDWGEDGLTDILPYVPVYPPGHPLVYWASDTHLGNDYRLHCAKQADLVFCAQQRAVEEWALEGVTAQWLPHAVEPRAYSDPRDAEGTTPYRFASHAYDVCFVGHVNSPNRIEALDRLYKEFPHFYFGRRLFNEAAEVYAKSKIVFNISHKDDLNMRVFEVLGSRSFLLTNTVPTLDSLFHDGVHLATYRTLDEMVEKAHYYLTHDEERDRITQQGYEAVMAQHTIDHRVARMLEGIDSWVAHQEVAHGGLVS